MSGESILDRQRVDIFATGHDAVVEPAEDVQMAVVGQPTRIARAKPRVGRDERFTEEAIHPGGPAHFDFSVDDTYFDSGKGRTHAGRTWIGEPLGAHLRATLAQPIGRQERPAECATSRQEFRRARGATDEDGAQGGRCFTPGKSRSSIVGRPRDA